MRAVHRGTLVCAVLLVASCGGKEDNSAITDKASQDLRAAQAALGERSKSLADNQEAIEQTTRDIASKQQQLADRQKLLEQQRQQLASAQADLNKARAAHAAAIKERFAKLDASLATLATRTDARSRDAAAGLRARRDLLAQKLAAPADAMAATWNDYIGDVDTTFDAIEHDLHEAMK
ncbi:MAG TPA: hypothetical protein VKB80_22065 [Kofleriaceae bacterium]|nr:hypothetical protein [Kofleriaceae bacterium]